MSTVEDIEKALSELPADQLAEFRAWFEAFDASRFDEKGLSGTQKRVALTSSPNTRSPISATVARESCEALRQSEFWQAYGKLPENVRVLADKNYALLKENPRHPSLQLKKVGRFWSIRVGNRYRALAVEENQNLIWFWIGSHGDYDALV